MASKRQPVRDDAHVRRARGLISSAGRRVSIPVAASMGLAVAIVAGAGAMHALRSSAQDASRSGASTLSHPHAFAKYLVLFVLDGGRPDYFKLTHLPHVQQLIHHGTQYTNAMDGILEAETPSGHAALATGSTPARDGILGFDWAQGAKNYSLFSPAVVRAGAIEHIMEARRVPTIAGLYKTRFPHAKVVALSGHKYYAADPLGGPKADAIMYYRGLSNGKYAPTAIPGHIPPASVLNDPSVTAPSSHLQLGEEDQYVTRLALKAYGVMKQRLTLINYPDFDWPLGHVYGGNSSPRKVITLMKVFDSDVARIESVYRRAGILKKTLFVITSDHGMMPIRRFVPQSIFSNAILKAGAQAPTVIQSTGVYIWLTQLGKAEGVARNIVAARDQGIQSVYYLRIGHGKPAYVPAAGLPVPPAVEAGNQFLLRTLLNGHEPTVVALLREYNTATNPGNNWKADHGGANWQSEHIPLILSGPGIRQGVTIAQPARITDIAPTLLHDMGVRPAGMEGRVLTDALSHPSAALTRARNAEIQRLTPFVKAYQRQDALIEGR